MRIVVALGGNVLLKRGEPMTHDVQRANIQVAAAFRFVEKTGKRAAIGALKDIEKIVAGEAGTNVYPK
jgi:carbamate kinase